MIGLDCLATTEADMVIFKIYSQFLLAWCFPKERRKKENSSSFSLVFPKVIWDLLNDDDSLDFSPNIVIIAGMSSRTKKKKKERKIEKKRQKRWKKNKNMFTRETMR